MEETMALSAALAASGLAWLAPKAWRRLQLSRAKHRSLAGHSRMAKRLATWLPGYAYDVKQRSRRCALTSPSAMRPALP